MQADVLWTPPLSKGAIPDEAAYAKAVAAKCGSFEKYLYQYLAVQYLAARNARRSLLLFHGLGTGKTCSAITLAETLLTSHRLGPKSLPPVWVIASPALQQSFMNEVYASHKRKVDWEDWHATCTGDRYLRFFPNAERMDPKTLKKKMRALIQSRYKFWTYDGFATALEGGLVPRNTAIIIDEAHNMRGADARLHSLLLEALRKGKGNRLVLMSATPMFNEADEITGLFELLLTNEQRHAEAAALLQGGRLFNTTTVRSRNAEAFKLIETYAADFVSYVRGANPFTFAARLNPEDCGIPVTPMEHVRDGLVTSALSDFQRDFWVARRPKYAKNEEDESIVAAQVQLMQATNVLYPVAPTDATGGFGVTGRRGFFQTFTNARTAQDTSFKASYITAKDCLKPGPALRKHAAKLDAIVGYVKSCKGIVMVYSEYVWAGVVPLAIALEHAGFTRYGESGMLAGARSSGAGSYAILSGTDEVMGQKTFTELLEAVNHQNNKNGEVVKVVLLTQVASEGLTLKNVREVHIMEPWYHLNQIEQVIGRALRTCSHTMLPLEDRNVTVFLHCAVAREGEITPDMHAFSIASRKFGQVAYVEKVLRDNAVDCAINKHVNYVPREVFEFDVSLRTSQGARVPWHFGDDVSLKPQCAAAAPIRALAHVPVSELRHLRNLLPTAMARIRSAMPRRGSVAIADLVRATHLPPTLAHAAILALSEHRHGDLFYRIHGDKFVAQKVTKRTAGVVLEVDMEATKGEEEEAVIEEPEEAKAKAKASADNTGAYLSTLLVVEQVQDARLAKIVLYTMLTRKAFFQFANDVCKSKVGASHPAVRLFDEEGVWLKEGSRIVGFVNIYTPRDTFEPWLVAGEEVFRAPVARADALRQERRFRDIPDKATTPRDTIGFFSLPRNKPSAKEDGQLLFQVLMPNSLTGAQRGADCKTKNMDDLKGLLTTFAPTFFEGLDAKVLKRFEVRRDLCQAIAVELDRYNQMLFPPYFKKGNT